MYLDRAIVRSILSPGYWLISPGALTLRSLVDLDLSYLCKLLPARLLFESAIANTSLAAIAAHAMRLSLYALQHKAPALIPGPSYPLVFPTACLVLRELYGSIRTHIDISPGSLKRDRLEFQDPILVLIKRE